MWEFSDELKLRKQELVESGYDAYCLFTLEGIETKLADELNKKYDYLVVSPLLKMAHRSRGGEKYDVQEVLLGGYLFVFLPKDKEIFYIKSDNYYFKVLSKNTDSGKMVLKDLEYAEWVLEQEGVLSVSQAIKIDGKVKIVGGPLKNLEGVIVEYSKKNRNCCIEIELMSQKIKTWLPFEWIDYNTDGLKKSR